MASRKKILVCPLDWGLGHATRLVPVIDFLLKKGHHIIIGADKRPLSFLKQRFPASESVVIPGYSVEYPEKGNMAISMLKSYRGMLKQAKESKSLLQKIISEKNIDIVISDNRYELSDSGVYSILITHQLNIQTPGLLKIFRPIINGKLDSYFNNFNEIWIPDLAGELNLSGKLSHFKKFHGNKYFFIGPLSRFSVLEKNTVKKTNNLLILLSGPEPQRSILENKLILQARETALKTIILQGKPELMDDKEDHNVRMLSHLNDVALAELIVSSQFIICRSGYSTIMDLAVLGCKAIFVPTPGQTEQEYLAKRFLKERKYYSESQSKFELNRAIKLSEDFSGISINDDKTLLESRIDSIQQL